MPSNEGKRALLCIGEGIGSQAGEPAARAEETGAAPTAAAEAGDGAHGA